MTNRLERLEARKATAFVPPPPVPLSMYVIAFFGGRYDAVASPLENHYRALGRERASEFEALTTEQRAERHDRPLARIFKKRRSDPATEWDKVVALFKKLHKAGIVPAELLGAGADAT